MQFRGVLLSAAFSVLAAGALGACAPFVASERSPRAGEGSGATLRADPMRRVRSEPAPPGARVVPAALVGSSSAAVGLGVEPGGGSRSIAAGVRIVSLLGGAVAVADDKLPGAKWDPVALPERLGGGFLFKVEERAIWRAEKWLAPARPIYASNAGIARIVPGLDRVYVLSAGGWHAFDGVTGDEKPLGPWPASPNVAAYGAADGWRALAIADLRGLVATSDAGATWRPLALPIDPREIVVKGDSFQVRGLEPGRGEATYEVRPDGQVTRVTDHFAEAQGSGAAARQGDDAAGAREPPGPLGPRALVAAVEDGWPLDDGTAIVARDGALLRVRLEDGAIVETATGAFPLRPARCHPMPLGGDGEIGFLCGEPRGQTVIYAFDAAPGRLSEVRRFDAPRVVLPSGNGAIAVRGPCDPHATGDADPEAHHYCIRTKGGGWREIRVEGGVGGERVAVLADGRFVIVSPPQRGVDAGTLTVVSGERAASVPIAFSRESADVARVLGVGVWLDGIEERRPGVLGGWIEAGGTMLGFELSLDGRVTFGELVRGDVALPMVSGRYGLGWSASRGGFETTNGGMNWSAISVPEPIKPLREVTSRACGPVGCSAAGWLRIGWGTSAPTPNPPLRAAVAPVPRPAPSLLLDCESADPVATHEADREDALGGPPLAAMGRESRVITYDGSDTLERAPRSGSIARAFAWGPRSGEWDRGNSARWVVRWAWPFGGRSEARASAAGPAPAIVLDAAKGGGVLALGLGLGLTIAIGDDASHALLLARRSPRTEQVIFELEADRIPVEVRRADGEPLGDIESAVRASGRWYLATEAPSARGMGRAESIVWQVDGALARELARIPRTSAPDGRIASGRLAARSDERTLGFVVDGQPLAERAGPTRWVAGIDLDTGSVVDVDLLGPFYLGDQRSIALCTADDAGFSLDLPLEGPSAIPISVSSRSAHGSPASLFGALHGAFARVRLAPSQVCVERLAGSLDGSVIARTSPASWPVPRSPSSSTSTSSALVGVSLAVIVKSGTDGKSRSLLRCSVR
jgi:hypothetical protein